MAKIINLTGQKFGRLTVISLFGRDTRGETIWQCKCDCGNTTNVLSSNLRKGRTKSCGCLQKQIASQQFSTFKDLTGQKFGKLTALYPLKKRLNNQIIWHCKCDCGNECDIRSYNLQHNTYSCGCLNQSHGEFIIENILKDFDIPFEKEKTFTSCIFKDTGQLARFDFWINNSYIIEFDGEQHFTYNNRGWNTKEHFLKTKEHDSFKELWCKQNNIPIIRIPYTHLEKITIEDLKIETSVFRKDI